jgi:hypothetical protein
VVESLAKPQGSSELEQQPSTAKGQRPATIWLRLCLFLAPVVLVICVPVLLVDPYALFPKGSLVRDSVRFENASRVNQVLLAIIAFGKSPTPNILLGDSQMAHFKATDIEAITHQRYTNLAFGGGTLAEAIATFWYATRIEELRNVYFGATFYSFTDNSRNRVGAAVQIVNNPLAYFPNGDVLEATWDDLLAEIFHHPVSYQPTVDTATFWRRQLGELARRKQTYSVSAQTLADLRAVVRYCHAHGVRIFFVIPPEHEDVRQRIQDLGMQDQYAAFKSAVIGLAPTYDCDVSSETTRDVHNFVDPFHTTQAAAALIVNDIWSGGHDQCAIRNSQ